MISGKVENLKVLEKTENSVILEFSVPKTSPYFDGHFPGFSILPAVAQVELIIRSASEYLATGINILEMRRIKFTKFIRPNISLSLRLEKKDKTLSFKIFASGEEEVYSSGLILVSKNPENSA